MFWTHSEPAPGTNQPSLLSEDGIFGWAQWRYEVSAACRASAPAVSPVEHWAVTASEAVLEAANQQIQKSNKVLQ